MSRRSQARINAVSAANATWTALRAQPQPPLVPQAPVRDVNPLSKLRTDYDKDYGTGEFDRITQATAPTSLVGSAISRLDQQQQQLQQQQLLDQQQQQLQQQQNLQDLWGRLPPAFTISGEQQQLVDQQQQLLDQQQQRQQRADDLRRQLLDQQQQRLEQQQQQQDAKEWMESRLYLGTKGGGRRKSKKKINIKNKMKSLRRSKSLRKNKYQK